MLRRSFLSLGLAAAGAALLDVGGREARADAPPQGKAKSCILLWMNGGQSHLDTFDPKPGRKVSGPTRALATATKGVSFSEYLPRLASLSGSLAVVRSLTSKEGSHERARQLGHTGYSPNPTVAHPALGAYASLYLGANTPDLPAYVSLAGPGGDSGMLGAAHAPFIVSEPGSRPDDTDPGVSPARFERRGRWLADLEQAFGKSTQNEAIRERGAVLEKTFRLMRSPKLAAFDLGDEPATARDAYGDSKFGKGCLVARRLVESGVPFVEVTLDGWDTHKDNFTRVKQQCAQLDAGMGALIADLKQRGLLDRTLVVCVGEFGRTPRISGDDGRDHHPAAWSAVLAGGGVRGGTVLGATDEDGEKVVADPMRVADLAATIATAMGLDPTATRMAPSGRPISLTDAGVVPSKLFGA